MNEKKKRNIIIAIILLLCIAVTTTIVLVTRNPRRTQGNQIADNGDIHTEEQMEDISISHDTSGNVTLSSNSTEGKTESAEENITEENITEDAEKPTTESGSTDDGNKPTGGTSGSTTSQPITTQTPTTQAQTTQTPNTTEQPSGGNQGGGDGGNTHQHTWEAQYRTVHHDEEGHYENVYKEAYDEPIYETHNFCTYCNLDITASGKSISSHIINCGRPLSEDDPRYIPGVITTEGAGYSADRIQVGTTHHEAVCEKKWILDKKAYDEQVLDGYKCTTCGATK